MQIQDRFKFRAKRIDNNEFVFGHLCFIYIDNPKKCSIYCPDTAQSYDCYTDTLGQCTGLKDKNGRLIYEGDIIKEIPKELCIASYFYDEYTYKVVFWYGRFGYTALDVNYAEQGDTFDFEFAKYDYEVIGNIHENPELLQEK